MATEKTMPHGAKEQRRRLQGAWSKSSTKSTGYIERKFVEVVLDPEAGLDPLRVVEHPGRVHRLALNLTRVFDHTGQAGSVTWYPCEGGRAATGKGKGGEVTDGTFSGILGRCRPAGAAPPPGLVPRLGTQAWYALFRSRLAHM